YESYMDYERVAFFMEQGYRAAKAAMPEIRARLAARYPEFAQNPGAAPEPPARGLTTAELDERIARAVDAARLEGSALGLSLRPSFHPELRFAADVSLRLRRGARPDFARYEFVSSAAAYPS